MSVPLEPEHLGDADDALSADDGGHHSSWRGAAVEHLVAATIALRGRGRINVAQTLWDAEGIDLMFEGPVPPSLRMRVQVKSIGSDTTNVVQRGRAVSIVRDATFSPREDGWVLFVLIDVMTLTFEKSWLVPSSDFAAHTKANSRGYRRFADGLNSRRSRWTPYRFETRKALSDRVARELGVV